MLSDPLRNAAASQTYGSSTDHDYHEVRDIQEGTTLIYVLYSTLDGIPRMNDDEHRAIFDMIDRNVDGSSSTHMTVQCCSLEPLYRNQLGDGLGRECGQRCDSLAGEYEVNVLSGLDIGLSANMTISCDGTSMLGNVTDKIHTDNVASKCNDTNATFYIENIYGSTKYDCLRRKGTSLVGSHYTDVNEYDGRVEYVLKTTHENLTREFWSNFTYDMARTYCENRGGRLRYYGATEYGVSGFHGDRVSDCSWMDGMLSI